MYVPLPVLPGGSNNPELFLSTKNNLLYSPQLKEKEAIFKVPWVA